MMNTKTLIIRRLVRSTQTGSKDELVLKPGVNVIAGRANTGKTKWLSMLDYLMGDKGQPEDAFGHDLRDKYDSIRALIEINGEEFWFERRWKQYGVKSKVFVDDEAINTDEFSQFLLEKLGIPILRFPKGSPYAERRWPELSWRTLLRHIYRQQRFWGDFADKQPDSEQHASLMQFLGIAEFLFSERQGDLVEIRKQIWKHQGAKESFLSVLGQISKELIEEKEVQVALTVDSINVAIRRLKSEVDELQQRREAALADLHDATKREERPTGEVREPTEFEQIGKEWVSLQSEKEDSLSLLAKTERRLEELQEYKTAVANEMSRMERVQSAGRVLADLKVTHCPSCDRPVDQTAVEPGVCFLCGQSRDDDQCPESEGSRVDLEIERLREEIQEAEELITTLSNDCDGRKSLLRKIEENIQRIENRLKPVRQAAATIIPPEIAMIDMEKGRLQERSRQMERIKILLQLQREMSKKIDELKHKEELLKAEVALISQQIDFEQAGDVLAGGMNTYLNALQAESTPLWTQPEVRVKLRERSFKVTVDSEKWSTKLGGTLILYFFLAYHYALLRLTREGVYHYPGLVILDLPATLEDGSTIKDKENFIVEPFVELVNGPGMEATQVIVAGAAFEGLEGVHRIDLTRVWK